MEDEERGLIYRPSSAEFQAAFDRRGAQWLSADCHRSQYGYPFRVGLQLALENRHRAVSFVSLACSGSDTAEGLFGPREPALEDCCGSGCVNCVFDVYEQAMARYEQRLQAWRERHPDAPDAAPSQEG